VPRISELNDVTNKSLAAEVLNFYFSHLNEWKQLLPRSLDRWLDFLKGHCTKNGTIFFRREYAAGELGVSEKTITRWKKKLVTCKILHILHEDGRFVLASFVPDILSRLAACVPANRTKMSRRYKEDKFQSYKPKDVSTQQQLFTSPPTPPRHWNSRTRIERKATNFSQMWRRQTPPNDDTEIDRRLAKLTKTELDHIEKQCKHTVEVDYQFPRIRTDFATLVQAEIRRVVRVQIAEERSQKQQSTSTGLCSFGFPTVSSPLLE
jgi:hypothetical protein